MISSHSVRTILFSLTLTLTLFTLVGCTTKTVQPTASVSNPAKAAQIGPIPPEVLKNALNTFTKTKADKVDLTKGPCLGTIAPDWVLDIAHNPRNQEDDKKENQCKDYLEGRAHHFIEMDESGELISAR